MFNFSSEFIDVYGIAAPDVAPGGVVTLTSTVLDRVAQRLRANAGGAILYFAPGVYELYVDPASTPQARRGPWEGDLVVPENVIAWFDNGAQLRLSGDARVVFHGGINAGPWWIFDEREDSMILLGSALDEVLPEWWGGDPTGERDSTLAVRNAVEAAGVRRQPRPAIANTMTNYRVPLPVVFRGSYRLSRTVVVGTPVASLPARGKYAAVFGATGANTGPLRGLVSGSLRERGTLFAGSAFRGRDRDACLLRFDAVRGGSIEDLAFDGGGVAERCLFIEGASTRSANGFRIRRCAFRGARSAALQLGQIRPTDTARRDERIRDTQAILFKGGIDVEVTVPVAPSPDPGADLVGLSVEDCTFEVADGARAIELRASNAVAVRLTDLRFEGDAATFVDLVAGTALLEGCDFANRRLPARRAPPTVTVVGPGVRSVGDLGYEAPDASDVFLRDDVSGVASRPQGQIGVAMVACSSRSTTVLDTVRPSTSAGERPLRSALMLATLHRPMVERGDGEDPSVRWGRPRRVSYLSRQEGMRVPMNSDMPLCVVGSALPRGLDVYYGAAQSALVCTSAALRPQDPVRFVAVRPGFTSPTIVFGPRLVPLIATLLMMMGCTGGAGGSVSPRDAAVDDVADARLDASPPLDVVDVVSDQATEDTVMRDGADGSVVSDAGTTRQWRRSCATMPSGDPAIPPPRLIYPMSPMRVTSQRPRFRWELPAGVTGARVELCRDPCCERPIASFDAAGSSGQPEAALPPGVVFWRARGRVGERVGRDVSFTWEISVKHRSAPVDSAWGTLKDFNGDGYDDIVARVQFDSRSKVSNALRIYWGGSGGIDANRFQQIDQPRIPVLLSVGDFDGDGFADLHFCLGADDPSTFDAYLLRGSAHGVTLSSRMAPFPGACWTGSVADFNGDGFGDIAARLLPISISSSAERAIGVTFGSPGGLDPGSSIRIPDPMPPRSQSTFGSVLIAPGDQNGNGYGDLVAAVGDTWGTIPRQILAYDGGPDGISRVPSARLTEDANQDPGGFAFQLAPLGDIDGDGLGDFLAARENARVFDMFVGDAVRRFRRVDGFQMRGEVYPGARPLAPIAPDLDGDGIGEFVYGCRDCTIDVMRELHGYVDAWKMASSPAREVFGSIDVGISNFRWFPYSITAAGDVDGDGYDDMVLGRFNILRSDSDGDALLVYYGGPNAPFRRQTVIRATSMDLSTVGRLGAAVI